VIDQQHNVVKRICLVYPIYIRTWHSCICLLWFCLYKNNVPSKHYNNTIIYH